MNRLPHHPEEPAWFVVRTATKREHVTACLMEKAIDCEVFAPRLRYKKATKRGPIWWVEPMFPGYFFAKFHYAEQYRHVQSQPGVTGLVNFAGHAPTIDAHVIDGLRDMIHQQDAPDASGTLVIKPQLQIGDEVEIAVGPFAGEKAVVSRVRPAVERVSLLLEFIGDTKEVEFDLYDLVTGRPTAVAS